MAMPQTQKAKPHLSLRWRIVLLVSAAALISVTVAVAMTYRRAKHEIEELMDGQMMTVAHLSLVSLRDSGADMGVLLRLDSLQAGKNRAKVPLKVRLSNGEGQVFSQSANVPVMSLAQAEGFETIAGAGETWRRLTVLDPNKARRVEVFASIALRDKEALEIARKAVRPFFFAFPLLLLLIVAAVRSGLRPLEAMAEEVSKRSLDHLEPLSLPAVPNEAKPLADAIDRLLERLLAARDNERRFTSDAAHELRTPLAAIRIQLQVARLSPEVSQREKALDNVQSGLDRASRLVEQMLGLARLDPLATLAQTTSMPTRDFLSDTLVDMRDVYPEADFLIESPADLNLHGDVGLLRVALSNLVDNAIRYGGGRITLFARTGENCLELGVADQGPGVAVDELVHLRERFFRGAAVQSIAGSGLGLAIVERIAELHGATLVLNNRMNGGFEAALRWALPQDQK